MKRLLILILGLIGGFSGFSQGIFLVSKSLIEFTSDAPLELIQAKSEKLEGAIKESDRSFIFRVPMTSFQGFNSSLQRTHFNENYLESAKYPNTVFEGKIIEEINFAIPGTYNVRGKGKFTCHGVSQERIIKCKLVVSPEKLKISSDFTVLLDDHNIQIPSVVNQKIAEEIQVHFEIEMIPKK